MIEHRHAQPQKPQRVIVLGAKGFVAGGIGKELAAQAIPYIALSASVLDLRQPESASKLAEILQLADALVFVSALTPDRGRDVKTLMANLSMAQHVGEALEKSPISHLLYVSTDAVYADDAPLIRSDSPCHPSSYHGVMHLTRETILRTTLQKNGCPVLILRPCAVYGPGDTHNSYGPNRFLRTAVKDGKIALFGNGEEIRDHLFIDDLSRLTVAALCQRSAGVLNVASGHSISFYDLAQQVARLCGRPVAIEGSPRANPITHRHFDHSESLRAFPSLHSTPLEQGLRAMLAGTHS